MPAAPVARGGSQAGGVRRRGEHARQRVGHPARLGAFALELPQQPPEPGPPGSPRTTLTSAHLAAIAEHCAHDGMHLRQDGDPRGPRLGRLEGRQGLGRCARRRGCPGDRAVDSPPPAGPSVAKEPSTAACRVRQRNHGGPRVGRPGGEAPRRVGRGSLGGAGGGPGRTGGPGGGEARQQSAQHGSLRLRRQRGCPGVPSGRAELSPHLAPCREQVRVARGSVTDLLGAAG
mmetsp:Transcript_77909/g.220882  ORF Transcript_77909/g.220882 Transcript_77909/m.220882 type:complete len:231 (+) Transcript_77909:1143-1835(+)